MHTMEWRTDVKGVTLQDDVKGVTLQDVSSRSYGP